uniref:Uncharacterized protein n=1 Tax=Anguilla anguilla TaxID=7936 RepID=A0A0E9XVV6_ANGAN
MLHVYFYWSMRVCVCVCACVHVCGVCLCVCVTWLVVTALPCSRVVSDTILSLLLKPADLQE